MSDPRIYQRVFGPYPTWSQMDAFDAETSPDEWTAELDGDGETDDVELEESGESEGWT